MNEGKVWPRVDERLMVEEMLRDANSQYWFEHEEFVKRSVQLQARNIPSGHLDDIVQDVMIRIYKSLPTFQYHCLFKYWLSRIVYGCIIDAYRKNVRANQLITPLGEFQDDDSKDTLLPRQTYLRGRQLFSHVLIEYVEQVDDALQHIHNRRLIHQDVKPENMLLDKRSEVLFTDLSINIEIQDLDAQMIHNVVGPIAYMAPERNDGQPREANDQYAPAIVVYKWLTDTSPFTGNKWRIVHQRLVD